MEAMMAKSSSDKQSASRKAASPRPSAENRDDRRAVIDALMGLAAELEWDDIDLGAVAERAGVSLSTLRGLFASKGAILAAFSRDIDRVVLDGIDPGMASEPARERLFDVLMRRIDALGPHKEAIGRLSRSFAHDPLSLAAWNRVVVTSMQWMLAAAAIGGDGPIGALRAQGLALAWSRILRVWLDDDDEGLARTMTEIDRQLRSGERWMRRADDFWRLTSPFRHFAVRSTRRRSRLRDRVRERFEDLAEGRRRRGRRDPYDDDAEAM
jgi:AcrR family transcriptional regulator